ncbi:type II secretion system F family protein [Pseudoclavibacter sp. 8L]|uniref:type II secretion system F family protein n=1 Tax=Pseudoclavibacter sp. 8L TaxID=2653162 RepID=UPI0012F2CEE7|nr:pilus assembly protein [Pseudoclavibacter sp. 8L]VXB58248.1 Pilus assembly protein [Pseudoclavibacter sp. 8L]
MTRLAIDEAEQTAAVVERLVALLLGGATATSAWQHVASFAAAESAHPGRERARVGSALRGELRRRAIAAFRVKAAPPSGDIAEPVELRVARGLRAGQRVGAMLREQQATSWRSLGCAWSLAELTGAPLARGLADLGQSFRDHAAAERDVELALAGPSSAARLVMGLPAVGVMLGLALGFDSLAMLFGTPIGRACLVGGLALMATAHLWNRALIAAASRRDPVPGLALDLTALGMLGGASASTVLHQVERVLEDADLAHGRRSSREASRSDGRIERVLGLARDAGVPAAELLRSEAALERRDARAASSRNAAQLGVRLMLPLGLCVLPAFLLLGVAPLILAVLTQTISRL